MACGGDDRTSVSGVVVGGISTPTHYNARFGDVFRSLLKSCLHVKKKNVSKRGCTDIIFLYDVFSRKAKSTLLIQMHAIK